MVANAKVLRSVPFLGKQRAVGEIITAQELLDGDVTENTLKALVSDHVLEIEGYSTPGGSAPMSAADHEALSSMRASFDNYREASDKRMDDLHDKIDTLLAASGTKPAVKKRGKK